MRDLSELNLNEGGTRVARSAPSSDVVAEFESRFEVTLPTEYLTVLRCSNGGHPELDSFELAGQSSGTRWSVNRFYHLDSDKTSTESLWTAMEVWRPILGKEALPFAEDGGGNQFFFDLRALPPTVNVCLHDDAFRVVRLAPSFEVFIDGLSLDPEMI